MTVDGATLDANVPLGTVPASVLVVDDEPNIRRTLEMVLGGAGYHVVSCDRAEQALRLLEERTRVDVVVVDLKLPGLSGLDALARIRADETTHALPVIVISGHATIHDAVAAVKLGANDFLEKPLNRERVLVSVGNSIRAAQLSRTVEEMRAQVERRYQMLGSSAPMQLLYSQIQRVAPTKAGVLITGESGSGKDMVSRAIHRLSPRRDAPFVKVNCSAVDQQYLPSDLFGHERSALPGALSGKRGAFEQAHGGTLFLDEVMALSPAAQAQLLHALQTGEVTPVGGARPLPVDVRVIAASNQDLGRAVEAGTFGEDLYLRLQVFPIRVAPLRERLEDVPALVQAFVTAFCEENGLPPREVDQSVIEALTRRQWPGNVRELKNVIERATILASQVITVADLPEDPHTNPFDDDGPSTPSAPSVDGAPLSLRQYREAAERSFIVRTLNDMEWNISRAAIRLGVERTNLHKKIRAYNIKRGERSDLG